MPIQNFTMLILNREGSDRGKISAFQAGDGNWGAKEKPPLFVFVQFEGELSHMQWAVTNCRYDFNKKVLVLNSDGGVFDPKTDVIENTPNFSLVDGYFGDRQLCLEVLPEPTGDDCNDLKPSFVGTDNMRSYWINLWYPLRKMKTGGQCANNGYDLIFNGYSNAPTTDSEDNSRISRTNWSIGITSLVRRRYARLGGRMVISGWY